jgi:hypothetical protein
MYGNTQKNGPFFGRVYTGPKPGVTDERRRSAGFDYKPSRMESATLVIEAKNGA